MENAPPLSSTVRAAVLAAALMATLGACRTTPPDGLAAPNLPTSGFSSLGAADLPWRAFKCGNTVVATECTGPLLAVSAQPSESDLAAAKSAGYRTVVNFRSPGEPGYVDERAAVEALGMRYVAIPVSGLDIRAEHADALAAVLRDPSASSVSLRGPVLMHCKSGTRAKMAWVVWLGRDGGLPVQQALAAGERAGLSGDPLAAAAKALR